MPTAIPKKMKRYRTQAVVLGVLYLLGFIFFLNTNPAELPLLLLVIPFMYIFAVVYMTVLLVCGLLRVKSAVFVSLVMSIFGVLLFVLGSLHQLTLRDVMISLALTSLLTWYVIRITNSRST